MLDTLKLESPPISEELAAKIEWWLRRRLGIENQTGEVVYERQSGSVKGSWESSVSVNVCRERFEMWKPPPGSTARPQPFKVECEPYVVFEGSVHKAMIGHNVCGGPVDLAASVSWFVGDFGARVGHELPHWSEWFVLQIDWTEVFEFSEYAGVSQYIHALAIARYARRKPRRYGDETVMFPGTTTAMKFYHKGPEFEQNGHKKLATATNAAYAEQVQRKANNLLRVEVSIKSKKLKSQYGGNPHPQDVSPQWVTSLFMVEVARVLKEGASDMEWIRNANEVEARLYEVYGAKLAGTLLGTWHRLAAHGDTAVRARLTKATYYRHRQQLADVGVSWISTDVYVRENSLIPRGFYPSLTDPRRVTGQDPLVSECLMGHPVSMAV